MHWHIILLLATWLWNIHGSTRNSWFFCGITYGLQWKFCRKYVSSRFCQGFIFSDNIFRGNCFLTILGCAEKVYPQEIFCRSLRSFPIRKHGYCEYTRRYFRSKQRRKIHMKLFSVGKSAGTLFYFFEQLIYSIKEK